VRSSLDNNVTAAVNAAVAAPGAEAALGEVEAEGSRWPSPDRPPTSRARNGFTSNVDVKGRRRNETVDHALCAVTQRYG
jgi:hypothetical protein